MDDDLKETVTPRMSRKEKGKAVDHSPKNGVKGSAKKTQGSSKKNDKSSKDGNKPSASGRIDGAAVTATGPAGRDRKRALKVGELERRRARDEKFDVNLGDGFSGVSHPPQIAKPCMAHRPDGSDPC
jgi:hypothetical protein